MLLQGMLGQSDCYIPGPIDDADLCCCCCPSLVSFFPCRMASTAETFGKLDWSNLTWVYAGFMLLPGSWQAEQTASLPTVHMNTALLHCPAHAPCPCSCSHPLRGERYTDSGLVPYGTSKLYMLMLARELSSRVPEVDFLGVHPGEAGWCSLTAS
jgi:hypothetical protein